MTSDPILDALRAVRARLRLSRAVETAARWTLYASMLACVCLAASKFLPVAPAFAVLAAIFPLAAAAGALVRPIPLSECAALVDGAFRLEERVTTAAEADDLTAMGRVLRADALRRLGVLDLRRVGRVRWPHEARLLAVMGALAAALALAPARSRGPSAEALTELEILGAREANRLSEMASDPRFAAQAPELRRIARLLREADPSALPEAALALQALESKVAAEAVAGPSSESGALEELADRLASSGAGLSRGLASAGLPVQPGLPALLEARLRESASPRGSGSSGRPESWSVPAAPDSRAVPTEVREAVRIALERPAWEPRYNEIVRRYYEER